MITANPTSAAGSGTQKVTIVGKPKADPGLIYPTIELNVEDLTQPTEDTSISSAAP